MADDLDDGEFWLPSDFLTDDDVIADLDLTSPSSSATTASVVSSTETDADDDDQLSHLSRSSLPSADKPISGWVLSSSPQSTLCGWMGKDGSSRGSPTPVSPPAPERKAAAEQGAGDGGATLDLLSRAAGEVARMKLRRESKTASSCGGTGFFDCSGGAKGLFCPPPKSNGGSGGKSNGNNKKSSNNSDLPPLLYSQPQFPHLPHFNRVATRNNSSNSNRPLGLPPSAWPPLQPQNYHPAPPPMFLSQPAPKGTGVFLPRRVAGPPEARKQKPDANGMKLKTGKGSQSQQKKGSRASKASDVEIKLPQEWIY